ncbi:MAG: hemerythrin [Bacteroidota bacterium]|nr:hemerythrin [Bacteroidota bacterium]
MILNEFQEKDSLVWDDSFLTGIDNIDFEHRIFFNLIIEIVNETKIQKTTNKLIRKVRELIKYAAFHFESEENFMLDIDYPEYDYHKSLHFDLIQEFNINNYEFENEVITIQKYIKFLVNWFINHTINEDIKIGNYFRSPDCSKIRNFDGT